MIVELNPQQKQTIIKILKEISRQCDVGAIAVVSVEGQQLAFFAERGADPIVLSALASALNAAGLQTVNQLKYGNLDQVIIKGDSGFVILQNTGKVITLAASRELFSLALSMQVLARYSSHIKNAIE